MTEVIVVCPANCATGGTEALHAFTYGINRYAGIDAKICYWMIKHDPPCPEEFRGYNCEYITEIPEGFEGVLVFPEIWANKALEYPTCSRAVYWLGIDAYAGWTQRKERGAFLEDSSIIHIAQSEYARDFLQKLGVPSIKCTDTLNEDFYEDYEEEARGDEVLYNPAKATPFLYNLIEQCRGIRFRPIQGMSRAEVIDVMRHSKLYIDFGEFPGRERIPREAVLCGCCIITSRIGSADYFGDFPHFYKYDSKEPHIWAIERKIRYVLDHYEECRKDFEGFLDKLWFEKDRVKCQQLEVVRAFIEVQHHNTCT